MMTENRKEELDRYGSLKKSCPARERLALLFDGGEYTETGLGTNAGVVTAYGYINGCPAYAFSQDVTTAGGAVSRMHSAKICRMFELASRNGVPVVGIYDSKGAFVEDGADALNAYSEILMNMSALSGVVPTASAVCGVCAGTMAIIASAADFTVAAKDAELYVSVSEKNSDGIAAVCAEDDKSALEAVRKYLSMMPQNNLSPVPEFEYETPDKADFSGGESAAESIADKDSKLELFKDFGKNSYTALCTVAGASAGIAAAYGKLNGDDCLKISRLVRLCDAYGLPVITVIDTEGFDTSEGVRSCAALSGAYAEASCAKIALVSGNAYGAAFIALAGKNVSADAVFALPEAVITPLDPITAAEFLHHDRLKGASDLAEERKKIAEEYAEKDGSPFKAAEKGAVDDVVSPEEARARIASVLDITAGKRLNKRLPKKHSVFSL